VLGEGSELPGRGLKALAQSNVKTVTNKQDISKRTAKRVEYLRGGNIGIFFRVVLGQSY